MLQSLHLCNTHRWRVRRYRTLRFRPGLNPKGTGKSTILHAILYLTDNAGEIVFDRLLIEQLPAGKVVVAVRGAPVLNDAVRADAETADLPDVAPVVDNGSDAPGTILDDCSAEFRGRYAAADLVIAKGQGNYETLAEEDKNLYFLFTVKCPLVAGRVGEPVGRLVARRQRRILEEPR